MSQEQFYDTLQSLSADEKTGRLVICGIEDSSTSFGNIELKDGELVRASYFNKTGNDAVSAMLALNITDMRFMVVTVADGEDPDMPTVATCLQQLWEKQQTEQQSGKALGSELQEEVLSILENFYGAGAASKVNAIAEEFLPSEQPVEFLDKCKSFVAQMCGDKMAEQMFAQLYEKVEIG